MRTALLLAFAVSLSAVAAPVPKDKAKPKDTEAIVGTWFLYSNVEGKENDHDAIRGFYSFEAGGAMTFGFRNGVPGRYELDPATSPGSLNLFTREGGKDVDPRAAIYKFEGDNLKVCMPTKSGGPRPTEFKETDATTLMTLKRKHIEKADR